MPRYIYEGLDGQGTQALMLKTAGGFLGTVELALHRWLSKGDAKHFHAGLAELKQTRGWEQRVIDDHPHSENAKDARRNIVELDKAIKALELRGA